MGCDFTNAPETEVLARARELVGRTLRQLHPNGLNARRGKGAFGQLVEELHFGYAPNSDASPDFPVARLELKATGVVRSRAAGWQAKERLVLGIVDYLNLPSEHAFRASAFFLKNARLLLVVYEWARDRDVLDHRINLVDVLELDALSPSDQKVIEDDWWTIRRFVEDGRAHELSEGHTNYLVAARKGAGKGLDLRPQPRSSLPAPQRAYSLKASFVSRVLTAAYDRQAQARLRELEAPLLTTSDLAAGLTLDDAVATRLRPYIGRTDKDIRNQVAPELNPRAKALHATLVRRMLGVQTREIEEFEKADVTLKVVRISASGNPREAVSFPAFRYADLARQTWRTSDLRYALTRRFLFAFFRYKEGVLVFERATFWTMPTATLEAEARRVWVETVCRVRRGRADDLPNTSFSPVVHVRPHARNASDTDVTPDGKRVVKKSFWLNASYVGEVYRSTAAADNF